MPAYSIVPINETMVIAWSLNTPISYIGTSNQVIFTIDIPAEYITKQGQSIVIEIWGSLRNATGASAIKLLLNGNDVSYTGSIGTNAILQDFYFRGVCTFLPSPDGSTQNGILLLSQQNTGSTRSYILRQNAGGNNIGDPQQLVLEVEAVSGTIEFTLEQSRVYITDSNDVNLYP